MKLRVCLALVLLLLISGLQLSSSELTDNLKKLSVSLQSDKLDEKISAIEKTGRLNNLPAVKLLFTLSTDKNPEVREALIKTLSGITDEKAINWLNETAVIFPDESIKLLAIEVIGRMGESSGQIFTGIVQALKDSDKSVRIAAVQALGKHPESISLLINPIFDPEFRQVREEAIKTVARYKDDLAAYMVLLNSGLEPDLDLNWFAEETLNQPITNTNIIEYLVHQWAASLHPLGRSIVAKIIGRQLPGISEAQFDVNDHIDSLLKDLDKEEIIPLISKIEALGNIGAVSYITEESGKKIGGELVKLLKEREEPDIRLHSATALLKLKDRYLPEGLKSITQEEKDWRVKSILQIKLNTKQEESVLNLTGVLANRHGENKVKVLKENGGSVETEKAIERGLFWLICHQELDGRWSCSKNNPFSGKTPLPDFSNEDELVDASVTGLAVLSFLGSGYTHTSGKYKDFIKRGLEYIISCQNESGLVNYEKTHKHNESCLAHGADHGKLPRRYNHNIGTLAIVEAYAMTKDKWLASYAQKALDHSRDYREPVYGWSFYLEPTDIGPSAYYIMAMTVGKSATDLNIYQSEINDARKYMDKLTQVISGKIYHLEGPVYCFGGYDSTATGIFCRMLLKLLVPDYDTIDEDKKAIAFLLKHFPVWNPYRGGAEKENQIGSEEKVIGTEDDIVNQWYWYFATVSFLNSKEFGHENYVKWNDTLKNLLIFHQRKGGELEGSWDPVCGWGSVGGRVYSTTFAILNLQAYYSYYFK